jgi:hypothetical protein
VIQIGTGQSYLSVVKTQVDNYSSNIDVIPPLQLRVGAIAQNQLLRRDRNAIVVRLSSVSIGWRSLVKLQLFGLTGRWLPAATWSAIWRLPDAGQKTHDKRQIFMFSQA